jgi:hypothetical protein
MEGSVTPPKLQKSLSKHVQIVPPLSDRHPSTFNMPEFLTEIGCL